MSLDKLFKKFKGGPGSGNYNHAGRPGKRGGSSSTGMETIGSFQKIIGLSKKAEENGETMYVRWSRGPKLDKEMGSSMDYTSYQRHQGLSAQPVRHDDPELAAQMIHEYKFLRRKDDKIFAWIFTGRQNGVDSDGAPTIDANSIKPVGKISETLLKKLDDYTWAYRDYRRDFSYGVLYSKNPTPSVVKRNAEVKKKLDEAWAAIP